MEREKDLELKECGVFMRDMLADDENPDVATVRDICEVRKHIRNRFRVPVLETTGLLGRKIHEVTHGDIMVEEEARLLARARRNLRMGVFARARDAYGEALQYRARKEGTEHIHNEEFGKYLAGKMVRQWRENGPDEGIKEMKGVDNRPFLNDELKQSIIEEMVFTVKNQILHRIQGRNFEEAVECLLKFAETVPFSFRDLHDMGLEPDEEEGLMRYLEVYMAELMEKNPGIYAAVSDFLAKKIGLTGVEGLNKSESVRKAAARKLVEAAGMGACYLSESLDVYDDAGVMDMEEAKQMPEVMNALGLRLGEAAKESPAAYVNMRDYYAVMGLISGDEADGLEQVGEGINHFLKELTEVHPELAMMYAARLRNDGIKTPIDGELQDEWAAYSRSSDAGVEYAYGEDFELLALKTFTEMADKANRYLEEDKRHELNVFNGVRHLYCLELAQFIRRYPFFGKYFPDFNPEEFLGDGKGKGSGESQGGNGEGTGSHGDAAKYQFPG